MSERHEVMTLEERNGAHEALANGQAIQQVRSSYVTAVAVQKPRQLNSVFRALLQEARLAGEEFYYGWSAGRDKVEGPSVQLALAASRCWGNCAVESLPVQELTDSWVFTSAFIDLETGFTLTRQFRQSKKSAVAGKLDAERKDDVRFQVGQSKSHRNVIVNALPSSLIRKALEEAKAGVRAHIEELVSKKGLPGAVDLALRALLKSGVKEPAILQKCGVAKREALSVDHLVMLKGDLTAIESGQERPEVLFPTVESEPTSPAPPTEAKPADEAVSPAPARKKALKKQLDAVRDLGKRLGMTPPEWDELASQYNLQSVQDASQEEASQYNLQSVQDASQEEATGMIQTLTEALAAKSAQEAEEQDEETRAEREAIQTAEAGGAN